MEYHDTRILIADENPAGRAQLREALNRAGYRHIEEATGGDDAIAKIERTHPDCVEMEGASLALVAYSNKLPCLVIRCMSDNANGDAGMSFDTFQGIAADNSAKLLLTMLELA